MKKKILLLAAVVIVVIIVIGLVSKSGVKSEVTIGIIDVLSGDKAPLGQNFKKGVEMARDEYAALHPDKKVTLIFEDDALDTAKGLAAFKKLQQENKIDALIVATSPTINAIYDEVSSTTIPVITYGTQSIEEKNDNVFHIFPNPIFADTALGLTMRTLNPSPTESVVGVYTNDMTLISFYNAFQDAVGQNITEFGLDMENSKSVQDAAKKVLEKKPKYVFMTNYANLGAQFIKELKSLSGGKIQQTLVFDLTFNKVLGDYEKVLGDLKVLDGSFVVSLKEVDSASFDQRYTKKYGEPRGELADFGYDSLSTLLETQGKTGSEWITNIQKSKINGTTGEISFDSIGRRVPSFTITQIKDGKIPVNK